MQPPTTSSIVRAILSADINLKADEVIKQARTRGVKVKDASIRDLVYNIRSDLKKKGAKAAPVPAAARETRAPAVVAPTPSAPPSDLSAVLSNVALVNTVVGACGGVEPARQVAEAVRACGGVEAFLQHLDLVAKVRGGTA